MRVSVLIAGLVACAAVHAQPAPMRVGWIHTGTEASGKPAVMTLRDALARLGHVEGRTYTLDIYYAEGRLDRYPAAVDRLAKQGSAVIVVPGYQGALAAKNGAPAVPAVGIGCGVELLVDSLARPGGNLTGVTCQSPDLVAKQLQLLRDLLPRMRTIALLYNSASPYTAASVQEVREHTKGRYSLAEIQVTAPADIGSAIQRMREARPDAVFVVADLLLYSNRVPLMKQILDARLPSIAAFPEFADAGATVSYGANLLALVDRAAWYVDRIGKGARPADLPMAQPTRFDLVVNARTAKALGIVVPPPVLARADRVID